MHVRGSVWLAVFVLLVMCGVTHASPDPEDAARAWVRAHATALRSKGNEAGAYDFSSLKPIIGTARFAAFGEAAHAGHEFFILRNEIFKYLVEELGFTAIACESGYADGIAVDDYVAGHGELTADIVAAAFSFAAPRAFAENRSLLEWMRAYNARPGVKRKIHFYGLEPIGKAGAAGQPHMRKAIDLALAYLRKVDAASASVFSSRLDPSLEKVVRAGYESLTPAERDAMTLTIADLIGLFERRHVDWAGRTTSLEFHRSYRNALNVRALDADLRNHGWWVSRAGDRNQRDASSALMAEWILSREGPDGRVLLFAHNLHVRKAAALAPPGKFTSMGQHLKEMQGENLVVIGSTFGSMSRAFEEERGYPPPSRSLPLPRNDVRVPAVLSKLDMPLYLVDLRSAPASGGTWWDDTRVNETFIDPRQCFDALIYVRLATPAQEIRLP